MEPLSLKLFGEVKLTGRQAGDIALPKKTRMLLAYLGSKAGNQVPRDKLAGMLWADRSEEQARHSLRQCLFTLAKAIGDDKPSIVIADRSSVALDLNFVDVDCGRFERLLTDDTPEAIAQACALYDGDFLTDVAFEDGILDAWCIAERTRLRELCFEGLVKLYAHYADTAKLDEAIDAARHLVALDPLREDGHRALMRLFARAGRRADALKQYRICSETLRAELSVEPEDATTTLYADIKGKKGDDRTETEVPEHPAETAAAASGLSEATAEPATNRKLVALVAGLFLVAVLAAAIFGLNFGQSS
jgi:DNA-binding SARP family transcriptional activator